MCLYHIDAVDAVGGAMVFLWCCFLHFCVGLRESACCALRKILLGVFVTRIGVPRVFGFCKQSIVWEQCALQGMLAVATHKNTTTVVNLG